MAERGNDELSDLSELSDQDARLDEKDADADSDAQVDENEDENSSGDEYGKLTPHSSLQPSKYRHLTPQRIRRRNALDSRQGKWSPAVGLRGKGRERR